jgi:hypothetical protein
MPSPAWGCGAARPLAGPRAWCGRNGGWPAGNTRPGSSRRQHAVHRAGWWYRPRMPGPAPEPAPPAPPAGLLSRLLQPTPTPYDPIAWLGRPLVERARMVCQAWALDGYGTPVATYGVHVVKIGFYVGMWMLFCGFTPGMTLATLPDWWLSPIAFQKAILWSLLFEVLGLGCGSGPLTGRYLPPVGGFLYFLRPGTTKLPLFPRLPLLGGHRRTWLDVALYAGLLGLTVRALVADAPSQGMILPLLAVIAVIGVADRTVFLAMRAEHYATTLVCFAFLTPWLAGAQAVQLALWFWAGFSKLNHHFPTVVCVMTSNSPFTRGSRLRRLMYRHYPDDLRPSWLAVAAGHAGTALELAVPIVLATATSQTQLIVGLALMITLHTFITSNVPMGVPIEWNVMVVYGGFALFWAHPGVHVTDLAAAHPAVVAFLAVALIGLPVAGNLWPRRISFLLAMRYYAGNWPYSVWLFRGDSYRKLDRLTKSSPWIYDQLAHFYERPTAVGLVGKVMAFRCMHLQGRALPTLIPRAVPDLAACEYLDGEIVAGLALGWNFGDGHLHHEPLLAAIQAQCGFEDGELRCIFVESQPLGGRTLAYRIHDAKSGLIDAGELPVDALRRRQPWESA